MSIKDYLNKIIDSSVIAKEQRQRQEEERAQRIKDFAPQFEKVAVTIISPVFEEASSVLRGRSFGSAVKLTAQEEYEGEKAGSLRVPASIRFSFCAENRPEDRISNSKTYNFIEFQADRVNQSVKFFALHTFIEGGGSIMDNHERNIALPDITTESVETLIKGAISATYR